jgi:acetylornithine deacetylase/succinyl-diaminopimelate desuccinylase-like protein
MSKEMLMLVDRERLAADTMRLVRIPSPTGDTRNVADAYERMLLEVGCEVKRYEFVPNNPTLVATYGGERQGKMILFNGHMDTIPLAHEPPYRKDERIYARGANDMKGSLACFIEVLRVLNASGSKLNGKLMLVANSMHESPGGRGEDLYALVEQEREQLQADAAIVMEGATHDCTVAQFGSATFEITVRREGEPSHQLYTPPGTPHPITVAAEIIRQIGELNAELEREYVEDIGYASYFIGSVHSGQFYNQHPDKAVLIGVRRYSPETDYADVERELSAVLNRIAEQFGVEIKLLLEKVRDGYRIDKTSEAVRMFASAARKVRGIPLPYVGKKIVTDAGIFARLSIPTLCHGPDQRSAHGEIEFVEIDELELTAKVYLEFIDEFGMLSGGA